MKIYLRAHILLRTLVFLLSAFIISRVASMVQAVVATGNASRYPGIFIFPGYSSGKPEVLWRQLNPCKAATGNSFNKIAHRSSG